MPSGGGGNTTTVQKAEPPKWQVPYMKDVLKEAETQYQAPGPFYYPGQTVADINPIQQASMAGATNYAQNGAQQVADTSRQAWMGQLGAGAMGQQALPFGFAAANPLMNPFFHQTADAIARPLQQTLTQQVLPQIDAGAVQNGQIGSSRQGIAQGLATQATQQAMADQLAKFGTNAYGQGLNTYSNTLGQALNAGNAALSQGGNINQLGITPSQILAGVGDNLNQYEQALINANVDRFNYNQNLPMNKLQNYANLIGNPYGSTGSTTAPAPETGGLSAGIGGAAAGLGLNSMLAPMASNFGWSGVLGTAATTMPWLAPLALGAAAYFS